MKGGRTIGVVGRLAALLGGLAAIATALALVLQDRALDHDLREAAVARLENSASVADRLIADHVRGVATRYAAISRTPELRANLDSNHAATLSFFASRLLADQGATLIAFADPDGQLMITAGDPRLVTAVSERIVADRTAMPACVRVGSAAGRRRGVAAWTECSYPTGAGEGTVFESGAELYAVALIPLRTDGLLDGGLVAVEAIGAGLLAEWSDLAGADLRTGPALPGELEAPVRLWPRLQLHVTTTYEAEQAIIDRSRKNLIISGILALALAVAAALVLARAFTRPIVRMREATERLSEGDLDHRIEVVRSDELGELGAAFNTLATRLTDSQESIRRTQRLARFGSWSFDVERGAFEGTSEFRRLLRLPEVGAIAVEGVLNRIHDSDRDAVRDVLASAVGRGRSFEIDVRVPATDGRDRVMQICGHAEGSPWRIEGSIQDVTEARDAEEKIRYLSLHDPLTGLGNREWALETVRARIAEREDTALTAAVVAIGDVRGVIETFGHASGDRMLCDAARRLSSNVRGHPRGAGSREDLIARLGDDRFLVVFDDVPAQRSAALAERLLAVLRRPFPLGDDEVTLIPSMGLARWPDDADSPDTLIRNAETALGRVEKDDPGGVRFYHGSMHQDATRRLLIASRLRRAIGERALELHYQPRVIGATGAVVGVEALARWTDDELGPVSPGEFIPIAESTGSIHALGSWCIAEAARQLRSWHEAGLGWVSVSVNLSRHQLRPALVDEVLAATGELDPSRFELEVTESALIEEGDAAIETLTALRAAGYRIALDDFGTGYSSLSYLQGLPIDTVKLDRGFIRDIADDEDAAALAGSVLAMCRALRLHTVIEGVETAEQLETLIGLGATEIQGFYFSRPLPSAESTVFLENATPVTREIVG